ncbi:MAG: lasso peptide biosynthesis B2 protein [Bacteroidales bacterium]|nr:lasso peptide biosynthesis B2 protein [Bacteroidales bacterium]
MEEQPEAFELIEIRKAIRRANKLAFWKNICLVKSVAARFMLQRRKIDSVMYLGLQFKDKKELIAHAWLIADDIQITPKGNINYKEIFSV